MIFQKYMLSFFKIPIYIIDFINAISLLNDSGSTEKEGGSYCFRNVRTLA